MERVEIRTVRVMLSVITTTGLEAVIDRLRADRRRVIGPTVRDGVIALDEIESLGDLPVGWTDEQVPGRYRAEERGTDELFGHAAPASSWKQLVYPERTLLVRSNREDGSMEAVEPEPTRLAFFGMRSCDLRSLELLDRVFLDVAATDPTYAERRADLFVVAVTCGSPAATCFCASMGSGPVPSAGHDLGLTEIGEDGSRRFVVDAATDAGRALLATLPHRDAGPEDLAAARDVGARAAAHMGRTLDPADPPVAAADLDHPRWTQVAERCLSCANCTMVCPTCFCSTTEDTTDLTGAVAERWRRWDSCFTLDFSYLHGGSVRQSGMSRYRQWLLHKLVTWHDQFDTSGCVGCGRCITWCPVGIDLTEEVAALAHSTGGSS